LSEPSSPAFGSKLTPRDAVSGQITKPLSAAVAGFVVYVDTNGNGRLDIEGEYATPTDEVIGGNEELLLAYLRDGVIVGHHIGHDVSMLDAGLERMGSDVRLLNRTLDTADLTWHLAQDGAFADRTLPGHLTLDTLADLFGVTPHDRHTASGDAFITALVFLRLLKLSSRHGRTSLGAISQEFVLPE